MKHGSSKVAGDLFHLFPWPTLSNYDIYLPNHDQDSACLWKPSDRDWMINLVLSYPNWIRFFYPFDLTYIGFCIWYNTWMTHYFLNPFSANPQSIGIEPLRALTKVRVRDKIRNMWEGWGKGVIKNMDWVESGTACVICYQSDNLN